MVVTEVNYTTSCKDIGSGACYIATRPVYAMTDIYYNFTTCLCGKLAAATEYICIYISIAIHQELVLTVGVYVCVWITGKLNNQYYPKLKIFIFIVSLLKAEDRLLHFTLAYIAYKPPVWYTRSGICCIEGPGVFSTQYGEVRLAVSGDNLCSVWESVCLLYP